MSSEKGGSLSMMLQGAATFVIPEAGSKGGRGGEENASVALRFRLYELADGCCMPDAGRLTLARYDDVHTLFCYGEEDSFVFSARVPLCLI